MDFRDRIRDGFGKFLAARGFQETSYFIDEKFFGNTVVVFRSDFLLRFVIDRGDFLIDISPNAEPERWYPLDCFLELIGYEWSFTAGLPDSQIAAVLNKEFDKITLLFAPENIEDTLNRLAKLALRPFRRLN